MSNVAVANVGSTVNNDDEALWDQKRKLKEEELNKSIERARLRRAEEERRLSEQRQAVCAEKLRLLDQKKAAAASSTLTTSAATANSQAEAPPNSAVNADENDANRANNPGYPIRPPPSDLPFTASQNINTAITNSYTQEEDYDENYDEYNSYGGNNTINNNPNLREDNFRQENANKHGYYDDYSNSSASSSNKRINSNSSGGSGSYKQSNATYMNPKFNANSVNPLRNSSNKSPLAQQQNQQQQPPQMTSSSSSSVAATANYSGSSNMRSNKHKYKYIEIFVRNGEFTHKK